MPMPISWRDHASAQAQTDISELYSQALTLIRRQLADHRGFSPFAIVTGYSGDHNLRMAPTASTKTAILDALTLGSDTTNSRAILIAIDVSLPPDGTDAAELLIEHADGVALQFIVPYSTGPDGAHLDTDRVTAAPGTRRIWTLRL
ncbi:hypothetical protein [Nocardia amikacinitolerans]|uniref:hypothetical protein n=1 Tax=Nocardia amikacinitolerans TaxID=756689 RepID=UPI0020A47992|nr:hypothetical protein [Nocardia amikacinitolerans]